MTESACGAVQAQMKQYMADPAAQSAALAEVLDHLEACPACAGRARRLLGALASEVAALPGGIDADDWLPETVVAVARGELGDEPPFYPKPAMPWRISPALVSQYFQGLFLRQPVLSFDSPGDRISVVNTGKEVGYALTAEPMVEHDGRLTLSVRMGPAALRDLPDGFLIEVVYLLTQDVVASARVDARARASLDTRDGLRISGVLPGAAEEPRDSASAAGSGLPQAAAMPVPRSALALRIRW